MRWVLVIAAVSHIAWAATSDATPADRRSFDFPALVISGRAPKTYTARAPSPSTPTNQMNGTRAIVVGSILMAIAVSMGAFGAHGLQDLLGRLDTAATFETAVRYHAWHALGLIGLGMLTNRKVPTERGRLVGWMLVFGIVTFSGSLYGLALEPSAKWLGPVAPFGGTALIASWIGFAHVAANLKGGEDEG